MVDMVDMGTRNNRLIDPGDVYAVEVLHAHAISYAVAIICTKYQGSSCGPVVSAKVSSNVGLIPS